MQVRLDIGEIISWSWQRTKKHLGFLIGFTLIYYIIGGGPSGLASFASERDLWLVSVILNLTSTIVSIVAGIVMLRVALDVVDKDKGSFEGLFVDFDMLGWYILASIIVTALAGFGMILLIIPGIIVSILLSFTMYIIIDKKMTSIDAIKYSYDIVKDNFWTVLVFFLAIMGINILGFIACCVGLLVTGPLTAIATAKLYRILDDAHNSGNDQFAYSSPTPPSEPEAPTTPQAAANSIPVRPIAPPDNAPKSNEYTYSKEEFNYTSNETKTSSSDEESET